MDTDGMFEIADDAIVLRSPGQMETRWRWEEIDDLRFRTYGQGGGRASHLLPQLTEILLYRCGETMRIPPSWLATSPTEAAPLMRRLETLMQRKLDSWASGTALVPIAPDVLWFFWTVVALWLALVLVAVVKQGPVGLVGLLLLPVLLPTLRSIRTGGLIVAAHFLRDGGKELRFRDLQTITIARVGRLEYWWLEGGGVRLLLGNGFDVPLLLRHVLRNSASAEFRYQVAEPRDPIQQLLYPVPPGAPRQYFPH